MGSHREAAAQAFPVGQSLHPDPFSLPFIVPEERWPHPIPREGMGVLLWCQPVARRMPSSSCCSWECCLPPKKGSLPALSLFPLLWSTFNICCNSIVQLPIGVNRQIAKAHFFFFFWTDRKLMQMAFTVVFDMCILTLISPIVHQGNKWHDHSPCPTRSLTRKTVKLFVLQSSVTWAYTFPEIKRVLWPN